MPGWLGAKMMTGFGAGMGQAISLVVSSAFTAAVDEGSTYPRWPRCRPEAPCSAGTSDLLSDADKRQLRPFLGAWPAYFGNRPPDCQYH